MPDREDQSDELLVLASIYTEEALVVDSTGNDPGVGSDDQAGRSSGKFYAAVDLPNAFSIQLKDSDDLRTVTHLPPITLSFTLPHDYPSAKPPIYTLTCPWLSEVQLKTLSSELDRLWEENSGMVVLFTWTSFLQTQTFEILELGNTLTVSQDLLEILLAHNDHKSAQKFAETLFSCEVCFRDRPGSASIRFDDCGHVYCRDCMREYFTTQISEGSVKRLVCPWDKCKSVASTQQVKDLVSKELFERYDQLQLQLALDTIPDLIYCPRKDCAYPVEIDRKDGMGCCPSCQYAFCTYCNKTYHYPAPCALTSSFAELRDKYLSASDSEREELDKRYGRRQIQDLIQNGFTTEWMEKHSKQCPHCHAQIQKIDGCNKMICGKCDSYFCWICLEVLPRDKPYGHFNNTASKCYDKLFLGLERHGEDEADNVPMFLNNNLDDSDSEDED